MDDASPFNPAGRGRRIMPEPVWEAARDDYLAGLSGPEVCARHGLRLGTFKQRAARDHWRRKDQLAPKSATRPLDEGQALEAEVDGDLDRLDYAQLAHVANCRMMRAVLRGGAIEALRWSRVEALMAARQDVVDQWVEENEAISAANRAAPDDDADQTDSTDRTDSTDLIFIEDGEDPPVALRWVGPKNLAPPGWLARSGTPPPDRS